MESVKNGLVTFCKGFGIWLALLILNTRGGEADVNGIKIILDIILAVILVGNYRIGKYIALLVAALSFVVTILQFPTGLEMLLIMGIAVLGGVLLKVVPEDTQNNWSTKQEAHGYDSFENNRQSWKSWNHLNPFEQYSFSPERGINICSGIIRRSYCTIPSVNTILRIDQKIWQRFLGLCNVSFQGRFTGQSFGEDCMKNIRLKSARALMKVL